MYCPSKLQTLNDESYVTDVNECEAGLFNIRKYIESQIST